MGCRVAPVLLAVASASLLARAAPAHGAPSVRLAVVVDEQIAGEPRRASDLEAAVVEALSGRPHVVFVDPSRAAVVREAARGRPLSSVEVAALVGSLDADLLLVGEVELAPIGSEIVPGLVTIEGTARLRLVAVDSAEVVGGLRAQAVGSHYGPKLAASKAAAALAKSLVPKLEPLLTTDRASPPRLELVVDVPAELDVHGSERIVRCLEGQLGADRVRTLHVGGGTMKLELLVEEAAREVARRLSPREGVCGLGIHAFSARALRARYRPELAGTVPVWASPFEGQGPLRRQDAWLRAELPRTLLTELAGHAFLDADPSAALGAKPPRGASGLRLGGSFSRAGPDVRIAARLSEAGSDRVVLSAQESCPGARIEPCLLAFARTFAGQAAGAIERSRVAPDAGATPTGRASGVEIASIVVDPIRPSWLPRYDRREPVGSVEVVNRSERELRGVQVRVELGALGARASASEPIAIAPGARARLPLTLWLDAARVAAHEGHRSLPLDLVVEHELDGLVHTVQRSVAALVLDKHALDWSGDPSGIAAFVAPEGALVKALVRAARAGLAEGLEHPLAEPAALLSVMQGLRYARDAVQPLAPDELDFVKFPGETWADGGGDCDDLSVLYAALLEAAGYPALLLVAPGHVLVAVGTRLPASAADRVSLDPDATFDHDGRLWVPVETTRAPGGFQAAWEAATRWSRELRRSGARPTLISVREGWKSHPPVDLAGAAAVAPIAPTRPGPIRAEIDGIEATRRQQLSAEVERLAARGTPEALNAMGTLLAFARRAKEARSAIEGSLAARETGAALNNLGNLEVLSSRPREALVAYDRALALEPRRVEVWLNAILASFFVAVDDPTAREALTRAVARAIELDARRVAAFLRHLPGQMRLPAGGPAPTLRGLAEVLERALRSSGVHVPEELAAEGTEGEIEPLLWWIWSR